MSHPLLFLIQMQGLILVGLIWISIISPPGAVHLNCRTNLPSHIHVLPDPHPCIVCSTQGFLTESTRALYIYASYPSNPSFLFEYVECRRNWRGSLQEEQREGPRAVGMGTWWKV
jgi:hypothetical protein